MIFFLPEKKENQLREQIFIFCILLLLNFILKRLFIGEFETSLQHLGCEVLNVAAKKKSEK